MADSPAQRKRNERVRTAAWLKERGAATVRVIMYRKTLADMEALCADLELTECDRYEDLITRLVHDAAEKLNRDSHER